MAPGTEGFQITLVLPNSEERTIQVGRDEHIWDAAFAAGIVLPALCHQGYCLTCAGRLENGGEVDQSDSLVYLPEDREAGFVLLCTGKPRSSLRIRTHQQKQMREFRKGKGLIAPYSWSNNQ
ncbi:MAG TPA: 2Fe-2S iron-sulfur cluster-binding protein [Terriglobales bacterium]|nr:2Fe-2S iron-sulfur cluster-binding protein [Terriglobales bacterium]